jgi:hypothetical protein
MMLMFLSGLAQRIGLRAMAMLAASLAVMFACFRLYAAGRMAERATTLRRTANVQAAMLRAAAARPRDRDDLDRRLRDGSF